MPAVRGGADKWKRRAAAATQDYVQGVQSPRRQWHEATAAASDTYAAGVQQAISEGRFARAATPAAGAKQQQKAATIGAQRYGPGIQASGDAYQQGFAPYAQVIQSVQLPARGPKGDPANYQRVQAIGTALNAKKRQMKGGA